MILSPTDALRELKEGNARYVAGAPRPWRANAELRAEVSKDQSPFACIVTCSDSRVPPEILFDQTIGDLFVIRIAGTLLTPEVVGSVEFAVEALDVKLVVVMAHSNCGAIRAAVSDLPLRGAVVSVIARLSSIVAIKKRQGFTGDELASEVSRQNTRNMLEQLPEQSPAIYDELSAGPIAIHPAYYDVATGRVSWTL
ncbi:carbonic anhydrase [bacterium]|nr:carbonic anhydrase [bacterium]